MHEFLWGSIGRKLNLENPGQLVKGLNYGLRKPQFDALVDADIGRRLDAKQLANIRTLALSKGIPEERVAPGFEQNLMMFTGSTEGRDRYGDRIAVDGWLTDDFKMNPVFLGFHDYEAPSIGQCLDVYTDTVDVQGKSIPNVRGAKTNMLKRLRFLMLWATETNPMAKILHSLYRDKDMRASSVGFIPEEVQVPADDDERSVLDLGPFGVFHKAQTLLELSAVSVPALPGAVADQYLDAYREAIPDAEVAGLRKLADQIRELDATLAAAIRTVLPSASRTFDFANAAAASKQASVETKKLAEAAKRADEAAKSVTIPPVAATDDEIKTLVGQMQEQGKDADIPNHLSLNEKRDWILAILDSGGELEQTDPAPDASAPGDKLGDMDSILASIDKPPEGAAANRGVSPEDVNQTLAPADAPFDPETLSADSFDFENLQTDEQRALVAGFFAWAEEVPPASHDQLQLGHHNREDGYVNLTGVRAAMDDLLAGRSTVPDEDRRIAYDHLALHYEQFGLEAPPFTAEAAAAGAPGEEGVSFEEASKNSPALGTGELGVALETRVDNYKRQLVSEVSDQLGIDIEVEERGGERKWRVVRAHKPRMAEVDEDFSRGEFEAAVGNNFELRRECSLMYDANDQKNPRAYLGQHHKAEEGTPVVWKKVRSTMRLLLSKAFDGTIGNEVRKRGFFHLRGHYDQFGQEPPAFRAVNHLVALGRFLRETSKDLTDGDKQVRDTAEATLDLVFMGYQNACDTAFEIQALKFPMKNWERDSAREFARERGYSVDHVVETDGAFIFEQRGRDEFASLSERTHDSESDAVVLAIGGKLRSGVGLLSEQVDAMKREFQAELRKLREQLSVQDPTPNNRVKSLLPVIDDSGEEAYSKIYEESALLARDLKDAVSQVAVKE